MQDDLTASEVMFLQHKVKTNENQAVSDKTRQVDNRDKDLEIGSLSAHKPTAEQGFLQGGLKKSMAALTGLNMELQGVRASLTLKQKCLNQTRKQLIEATTGLGDLD